MIVQAETVLRWRRNGWSAIWRYRSRGRWRGGRPRVSSEVRHLITQMARENFLWGAPRIHGELLMLGRTRGAMHYAQRLDRAPGALMESARQSSSDRHSHAKAAV